MQKLANLQLIIRNKHETLPPSPNLSHNLSTTTALVDKKEQRETLASYNETLATENRKIPTTHNTTPVKIYFKI